MQARANFVKFRQLTDWERNSNPYITASGLVTQPTAQLPMITGGGGLPLGYATGGASGLGLVNNTTGGLSLTTDQMGSWVVTGHQNNGPQMGAIPSVLPGGEQRTAINHQRGHGILPRPGEPGSNSYSQGSAGFQASALAQLQTLQRLAALNQVSPVRISV